MRIISGSHKGRRLSAPKNLPVRPTTDFAKEGLFNILRNQFNFSEINVLDLFAGTGNISFEFASRGVTEITSVDSYYGCVQYISKIAEEFEFPIQVIKATTEKFLTNSNGKYSIIFADPPYNFEVEDLSKIVSTIFENNLLKEEGIIIIEHAKHRDLSQISHFKHLRKYGGSVFSFFD
ncbi:RsmD family RNA methyltransferase [Jejudonia soesokkakensis]|uniref:RsmD family RNA methyltransferase n=1 Tax=Jejudonia soesokkakensis TaxID=1323432 RepID=A0ABW2MX55_9FLAO